MKRLIVIVVAGSIGCIAGFGAGIFIYPFWFLTEAAHEVLEENASRMPLASGEFRHVNKSDPIHWGKGGVRVYREGGGRSVVHLKDDFEVGPGPRFHVYLVDHPMVAGADDFRKSAKIDLGRLRAFKGSQIYPTPPGADASKFRSVVIWCKEFGVLISPASLKPAAKPATS